MSFLWKSSIGRKLVMSVSGLFLILFLAFHAGMNVVAIFSKEGYNFICGVLGTNWYALVGTMVLAAGFLVHIVYAFVLTLQNRKARGNQRYQMSAQHGVTWASRNMFVIGLIVVLGILLHMVQFWSRMQLAELLGNHTNNVDLSTHNGYDLIAYVFKNPVNCVLYIVWFAAIWFHLTHGFWSALQTIGWNNGVWLNRLKTISTVFSTIICLAFFSVVIVFYLRGAGILPPLSA